MSRNDWLIIGISGVTCGGKTSLANRLIEALTPVSVFHQDKYFYPDDSPKHIKCAGLDHNNYDVLSALDMDAMFKDMNVTIAGEDKAHASSDVDDGKRFKLKGKRFMVVDGFTALNYQPIMEICDLRYYFVLEYEECAARRAFRLYEPPDVDGYFQTCVWPEHIKYRALIEQDKRVKLLDGTQPNSFDIVMHDLRTLST